MKLGRKIGYALVAIVVLGGFLQLMVEYTVSKNLDQKMAAIQGGTYGRFTYQRIECFDRHYSFVPFVPAVFCSPRIELAEHGGKSGHATIAAKMVQITPTLSGGVEIKSNDPFEIHVMPANGVKDATVNVYNEGLRVSLRQGGEPSFKMQAKGVAFVAVKDKPALMCGVDEVDLNMQVNKKKDAALMIGKINGVNVSRSLLRGKALKAGTEDVAMLPGLRVKMNIDGVSGFFSGKGDTRFKVEDFALGYEGDEGSYIGADVDLTMHASQKPPVTGRALFYSPDPKKVIDEMFKQGVISEQLYRGALSFSANTVRDQKVQGKDVKAVELSFGYMLGINGVPVLRLVN